MSNAHDRTEKAMRNLHVMLSKGEPYEKQPTKVIVDKQQMLDLLTELNKGIFDLMEEYEQTQRSRDRAERKFQKHGEEIIADATVKAQDIYAASVMYTDHALSSVQEIMRQAQKQVEEIYKELGTKLKEEERVVRTNQLDLKSTLQDLEDTEKYLKLINQENNKRKREEEAREGKAPIKEEANRYADRQTEIRVNTAVLEQLGLSAAEEPIEETPEVDEEALRADLDADYFAWKEGEEEPDEEKSEGGIRGILKGLKGTKKQ